MMVSARDSIPGPAGLPFVGNIFDVQDEVASRGAERLADIYGPIMKLSVFGTERIIVSSEELAEELCDEKRFWKSTSDVVSNLKDAKNSHSGLFTAPSEDDVDWQVAHRTLMPAFGPLAIQQMFEEMHDIASQLVLKWARMGPANRIDVTADFTRLTLDTIALCAMDYRFNSFYQDDLHPYVKAMNSTFAATSENGKIGPMIRKMMPWDNSTEKVRKDRGYMRGICKELVQVRRDNPTDKRDLLNAMILGKDPKTGESMSEGLIAANMNTFLIAGHETTSGLLSFSMAQLLRNPRAYFKAQQEVDSVLGKKKMTVDNLKDLKYINAVLRETLRLTPTVPAFLRSIRRDNPNDFEELLGGKYAIDRKDKVVLLVGKIQKDPKVYGEDANDFKPERMLDENFVRLPKAAWKPFGTGVRSCIGRAFAWQEAQMALALLLQNFNFKLDEPSYELKIKQSLTIKPDGFYMRATLREGITATTLQNSLTSHEQEVHSAMNGSVQKPGLAEGEAKPMTIIYGSNTGTCQSLAQKLSMEARQHGYVASVMEMNAIIGVLPRSQPVVILTASYEGEAPDNADQFVAWLETSKGTELENVEFAVFGCGHSDWRSTFHRIPKLVDDLCGRHGGKRLVDAGLTDVAKGDIFSDFDHWSDHHFWPAVTPDGQANHPDASPLEIDISSQNRSAYLRQDVQIAKVHDAKKLTADGHPEKRHLEIQLPENITYETGDYLAILPLNPVQNVERVMKYFDIAQDATITIKPGAATFLPVGTPLTVADLLSGFVELSTPATKKDIQVCLNAMRDESESDKAALERFLGKEGRDGYSEIIEHRVSIMDLLSKHTSIDLPFGTFLSMLPPLRPRHYSISSSPLKDPSLCTVTYAIIDEVAKSGVGRYIGTTSSYLSHLCAGDQVQVSVRSTNKYFHLPAAIGTTPIIMVGAGTGIAPFRGFIQERATQLAAGRKLAPALLFMGCRTSSDDRLYADELDAWAAVGAVDVRYAFSREPELSAGCKYVQDRYWHDREDVLRLWRSDAKLFICGSPAVSEGLGDVAQRMLKESMAARGKELSESEAREWFAERRNERYVVDVFA